MNLIPHDPEDTVQLQSNISATCVRSVHRVPSLAWIVERTSGKLKPQFVGRPGDELRRLRQEGVEITDSVRTPMICVSGDTRFELFTREPRVRRCRVLCFEVTAWDESRSVEEIRQWGHTHVDEVIEHAEAFEGEAFVLVHRSPRHSRSEAERIVADRFPASIRDRVHVFGT